MSVSSGLPSWPQVRLVAQRQRHVLWAFLVGLLLLPASLVAAEAAGGAGVGFGEVLVIAVVATRIAMGVTVYRLASAWGSKLSLLWGIGAFLPNLIGLVVLLFGNGKATRLLKAAGVKVGFFGVSVPESPPPGSRYSVSDVFS